MRSNRWDPPQPQTGESRTGAPVLMAIMKTVVTTRRRYGVTRACTSRRSARRLVTMTPVKAVLRRIRDVSDAPDARGTLHMPNAVVGTEGSAVAFDAGITVVV